MLLQMGCVYILIEYQHPEDRNQAWFPKIVVVFGLTIAVCSVLMFPLVSSRCCGSCTGRMQIMPCWSTMQAHTRLHASTECPRHLTQTTACCSNRPKRLTMCLQDVANKAACSLGVSPSACKYTLPMYQLWLAVFVGNLVLVFAIIPFTLFFYEADSDL